MEVNELREIVSGGESGRTEFKETTSELVSATHSVCAMLNAEGGHVLFGVTDDANIRGQSVGNNTIEKISREIQDIGPRAYPKIHVTKLDDQKSVIAIRIKGGLEKPYRYKGVPYKRLGNRTLKMSEEEASQMLIERIHDGRRWESEIAEGWTPEYLNTAEIVRTVERSIEIGRITDPDTRDAAQLLRGMSLSTGAQLFRASAVLFGNIDQIQSHMPQCLLRLARFRGSDQTDFIDNRQVRGNAFVMLQEAENFIRQNVRIPGRFAVEQFIRIDEPIYPFTAVREALANAVCHRDYADPSGSVAVAIYDDRLEIVSTGPLRFGLKPEDLYQPHPSRPWNPLIAEVFYRRGIIEGWGSGTIRMARESLAMGLPKPEIRDLNGSVTVIFRPVGVYTPRQHAILALLYQTEDGLPLREITALITGMGNERQIREELYRLRDRGLTSISGRGAGARWHMVERY